MRQTLVAIVIAFAGIAGLLATPPVAAAAEGYGSTASTVYRFDPAKGLLRVTVTLKITNRTPDKQEPYSCVSYIGGIIPYPDTCYRTVRYYLSTASAVVENEAKSIKAVSGQKTLPTTAGQQGAYYRVVTVSIPKLFNGATRTVRLTYTVKGGKPRSDSATRTMKAYVRFCTVANGEDQGSVSVRLPVGFTVDVTGATMRARKDGAERVWSSGKVKQPTDWFACFDGSNPAGYRSQTVAATGGRTVVLRSWPEDPSWASGVRADMASGLPALEHLIGTQLPADALRNVEESSTGSEYAGFYDAKTNTVTVGEDYTQPALVEHELAHAWFNGTVFRETWLSEGFAEWAGRAVSGDEGACTRPGGGAVTLATWQYLTPRSTDAERSAVKLQYDAACWVVTAVASAAGDERTTLAVTALLDRRDPYAVDDTGKRASRIATWKDWLDAMDEVALAPVGGSDTLASGLVVEFGVATDRTLLDERTATRQAYRMLARTVGGWVVPAAVRAPMAAWTFGAARDAIEAAGRTWTLTGETDEALAGVDARHGPAADAWEKAVTVTDLQAASKLAERQLTAARDVAAAQDELSRELDPVERIGLVGTQIPSLDAAIPLVRAGDGNAAAGVTASFRAAMGGLRATGEQRIVGGVIALVLVAIALVLVARSRLVVRSRRRRVLAVAGAQPVGGGSQVAIASASPMRGSAAVLDDADPSVSGSLAGSPSTADGRPLRPWSTASTDDDDTTQFWEPAVTADPDPDLGSLVRSPKSGDVPPSSLPPPPPGPPRN